MNADLDLAGLEALLARLRRFAETGRDRRCNVAINRYHAETIDEAVNATEALLSRHKEMREALEPFAKVATAYAYWSPEVMPDLTYPVAGTDLTLGQEDCPAAIGALSPADFDRARAALTKDAPHVR